MFDKEHPYFPKDCTHCSFRRNKGLKNVFKNQDKHCDSCNNINAVIKQEKDQKELTEIIRALPDIKPPHVEDYISHYDGMVMESPLHGKNEREENLRLAKFIVDHTGQRVYLLPRINSNTEQQLADRKKYMPPGVFDKKNPDFLIGGLLFEGKSMHKVKFTQNEDAMHSSLNNHIKSAKEQAENFTIEVSLFIPEKRKHKTMNDYIKNSKSPKIIIIQHGNKMFIYQKPRN